MSGYLLVKTLHVLSAAVLSGTGGGIAFFAWFGYRRALRVGQIDGLRTVLSLTVAADSWFTTPAVVIQLLTGLWMMHVNGWSLRSPWALTVLAIYTAIGLCWLPVVVLQWRMNRQAQRAVDVAALGPGFHRRFRCWFALGVPAFAGVLALYGLMLLKPLSLVP